MLITTGRITNHISITVFKPDFQNSLNPGAFNPTIVASSKPYPSAVLPSGSFSNLVFSETSLVNSSGILF